MIRGGDDNSEEDSGNSWNPLTKLKPSGRFQISESGSSGPPSFSFSSPIFVSLSGSGWQTCGIVAFVYALSWVCDGQHVEERILRIRFH